MTYKKPATAEEKAAAREASQAVTAELIQRIDQRLELLADQLKQGASAELLEFMRFCAQFHSYSMSNQMLIWLQAPAAQFVAGFHDWKVKGRTVKKGAKAVRILAPCTVIDREAAPVDGKQPYKVVGFRYVSVFADHDTEGDPIPGNGFMTVQGGDDQTRVLLEKLSSAAPVPVEWVSDDTRQAHGWTDGGKIVLNRPKCAEQPAHALRVFFHEWAHVVLHFQAAGKKAEDCPDRHTRELEADAAAYVLASFHGVEATAQVSDYITNWGGNPDALRASLTRIQKAVTEIMGRLDKAQDAPAEAKAA